MNERPTAELWVAKRNSQKNTREHLVRICLFKEARLVIFEASFEDWRARRRYMVVLYA